MKCANPLCSREEHYFRSGTLYSVDYDPPEYLANGHVARQKVVWLCEICSRNFRVQTWRPPGEQICALNQERAAPRQARAEIELKEVSKSAA